MTFIKSYGIIKNMMKRTIVCLLLTLFFTTLAKADIGSLTATPKHQKIVLTWINNDLDVITLVRDTNGYPGTISEGIPVYSGTATTFIDDKLFNEVTYYYTAFDCAGSFSCASATPQRDISPPSPPGTVTEDFPDKDINTIGSYTIYWTTAQDDDSDIIQYAVQERIGTGGTWGTIGYTSQLSYGVTGKIVGNVYYYRVSAKNEAELWSSYSSTSDGIRIVNKAVEIPATSSINYGQITIDVAADAFIGSVTFTISQVLPPANFASSTPLMSQFLSQCYELLAFNSGTLIEVQPTKSLLVIFSYSPINAGTESDYRIYRYVDGLWQMVAGTQTVIPNENLVTVRIGSLSTYVVGYPEATLTEVSNFTATPGNNRQMTLNWIFPVDNRVTEVIIRKNTGTYATTPKEGTQIYRGTLTNYTETLLTPGTTCYYTAFTSDGGANYSSPVFSEAVATDTTLPGLVGSFTAKGEFKKIVLNWINPADEDFKEVKIIRNLYYFPQNSEDGDQIYQGQGTSTVDTKNIINGQIYYYTAFSYDGIYYSLATTTVQATATVIQDETPPSAIGTITEGYVSIDLDVTSTGNYLVSWSFATDTESGIAGYELQERKDSGEWGTISDNIIQTYYYITARQYGSIYYYRVRAKNGADIYGSWSTTDGIRVVSRYFTLPSAVSYGTGTEKIQVDVSANAFDGTTTFTLTIFPILPVTNFNQATPKIKKSISSAWQLLAINSNNEEVMPTATLTIFITYPEAGFSSDEEMQLKIYRLNNNYWEMLPPENQIVRLDENIIQATITTLSTFIVALPSSPAVSLSNVRVYPNPFKPSKGHDKITFDGLADAVKIRIYKITGELVYEKEYLATSGYVFWNGTNNHGQTLASGVYIYVIEGSGEKAIGKIAIIN
ncbi:MAG: gliding motility-associated C-terminal domain-containing protein [bacterium]